MSFQTLIRGEQLVAALGDPRWRIFDCRFDLADNARGERDYRQSHIPGAFYAHLDHDLSSPITPHSGRHPLPDVDRLCDWLGQHGVAADTQVVVYDDSGGNMAVRLWWLLRWLGHSRVALLDGGWPGWQRASLPIEQTPPTRPQACAFDGRPDWQQVVTTEQLAAQLDDAEPPLLVMDARTRERFRGEVEPIDPVAGHIPGAVNVPLQDNLAADGTFKSAQALQAMYRAALGGRPPGAVAAMCGSGVTACHNLLAMAVAGLDGGRLYAGSWSEWIRDPAHPVATGD